GSPRDRRHDEEQCPGMFEGHRRTPTTPAALRRITAGRITSARRNLPNKSHSASKPAAPANVSHGQTSLEASLTWDARGIPLGASAGGSHLLSPSCGSVNEKRYSRSPATTRTEPGAPEKKLSARSRNVNGSAEPSSAVTLISCSAVF